jgi:hypothetical protein
MLLCGRLLNATRIVQTYFRRYAAILLRWRKLCRIWNSIESQQIAALRIQQKFRIFMSKNKIRKIKNLIRLRYQSALRIQYFYYFIKNNFSTFFLMSAYRITDAENKAFYMSMIRRGNGYCLSGHVLFIDRHTCERLLG